MISDIQWMLNATRMNCVGIPTYRDPDGLWKMHVSRIQLINFADALHHATMVCSFADEASYRASKSWPPRKGSKQTPVRSGNSTATGASCEPPPTESNMAH